MKIKLIYREGYDTFFVRYADGNFRIVKSNEAAKLSFEQNIFIGESEYNESRNIKLDWSNGIPILSYFQKNREKLCEYQREYRNKKKLDKVFTSR